MRVLVVLSLMLAFAGVSSANLGKIDPKLRHLMARAKDGQIVRGAAVRSNQPYPHDLVRLLQRLSVNRNATEKLAKRLFRSAAYRDARILGVAKVAGGK